MFRRRDEDEIEFTLQPTNKGFTSGATGSSQVTSSGNPVHVPHNPANAYATQTPGQSSMQSFAPYSPPSEEPIAPAQNQSGAPFIRTNGAYQDNARPEPIKESKPAKSSPTQILSMYQI